MVSAHSPLYSWQATRARRPRGSRRPRCRPAPAACLCQAASRPAAGSPRTPRAVSPAGLGLGPSSRLGLGWQGLCCRGAGALPPGRGVAAPSGTPRPRSIEGGPRRCHGDLSPQAGGCRGRGGWQRWMASWQPRCVAAGRRQGWPRRLSPARPRLPAGASCGAWRWCGSRRTLLAGGCPSSR